MQRPEGPLGAKYESHWSESEALLAVTADDDEYAAQMISTMTTAEAETLLHHLKTLRHLLLDHLRALPTIPEVISGLRDMIREP